MYLVYFPFWGIISMLNTHKSDGVFADMPFRCLRWIWEILYVVIPAIEYSYPHETSVYLPDDVMINILSRLPAESLLACQKVCKQWRSLTSSPCFIRLFLQRVTPVIFMRVNFIRTSHGMLADGHETASFLFDHTTSGTLKIQKLKLKEDLMLPGDNYPLILSSCGGFLLFASPGRYYIVNPLTQEHAGFYRPEPGYLRGFFYHSSRNEFKILYALRVGNNYLHEHYIYTLGANNWRKIKAPHLPYSPPPGKSAPAICNGSLHWIVCQTSDWENDRPCLCNILVFKMDAEEFFLLPRPWETSWKKFGYQTMNLFALGDSLAFCNLNCTLGMIEVHILEDYASGFWVLKWTLDLRRAERPAVVDHPKLVSVKLLLIHNEELWLDCYERGVYVYHLERNTVRRLGGPPWSLFAAFGRGIVTHDCVPYVRSHLRLPESMFTQKLPL
ncbi:OLC1v1002082C1 [Oldenlandia corymbosa var. corymbosa]|uniref:OLC1v1002082C1 n=1 Tax=Oldenlandia corymbosa var. corymbosa TaxID=529605 RepID=A0AAV1D6S9_OLDCO|nr:OLC1v1002082C1 [Oldenlandia corymbosa var. corymbosa]